MRVYAAANNEALKTFWLCVGVIALVPLIFSLLKLVGTPLLLRVLLAFSVVFIAKTLFVIKALGEKEGKAQRKVQ